MVRLFFAAGALLAGLSVGMGAYGAHGAGFDEIQAGWVETAARYQMYHALALLVTALVLAGGPVHHRCALLAGWCFLAGTALFSGSLYVMALTPLAAGYLTPAGGMLLLLGWLLLALAVPGGATRD